MSDHWQAPGGTGQPGPPGQVGPPGLPPFSAYSSAADALQSDPLPTRWARLGANLIDAVAQAVVCISAAGLAAAAGVGDGTSWWRVGVADVGASILWSVVFLAVSAAHEVVGFGQRGRTIGKVLLHLRVADVRTQLPMTWRASVVRWVVKNPVGQVPFAGPVFELVDALFVFREDKRTLHDHAAGTVVLRA